MKKLLLLLSLIVSASSVWAQSTTIDGVKYTVTGSGTASASAADKNITSATILASVTMNGNAYNVTSIGNDGFYNCKDLTSVIIPEGVTSIGASAFAGCHSLTSIDIPNSVTSIGNYGFASCKSLTSIDIPNSVTSIGDYWFFSCENLTSVIIPEGVTSIGMGAFESTGLTSVTIPASVTSIVNPFADCRQLATIEVEEGNEVCKVKDGILYSSDGETLICCPAGAGVTHCDVEEGVKTIAYGAFLGNSDLRSVTLPEGLTTIDVEAFRECIGLTSIRIPESVTYLGDYAFNGCNLTSLTIPGNVTEFQTDICSDNPNLKTVNIVNPLKLTSGSWSIDDLWQTILNCGKGVRLVLNSNNLNDEFLADMAAAKATYREGSVEDEIILPFDYPLTVSDAGAATLYLPFAVQIPEDVDYFVAATVSSVSISGSTGYAHMKMIRKGVIPANTGVIIQANPGTYTLSMTTETTGESVGSILEGVLEETDCADIEDGGYDVYVLRRGLTENLGFKHVGEGSDLTTLAPFKAYLPIEQGAGVKAVSLTFGGEPTAIEDVEATGGKEAAPVYHNLNGQRVAAPGKGIYIVNGKKVLFN